MCEKPFDLCHLSIIWAHSCTTPCVVQHMNFHRICVNHRDRLFDRKAVWSMPPFHYRDALLYDPCLPPWHLYFSKEKPPRSRVYPPPSWPHAILCLYVIGRESWVWDMSHVRARWTSSHGMRVGTIICSVATCRWFIGSSLP